ncbi:unnamed protein product, partial [Choristocarpus tenellus]
MSANKEGGNVSSATNIASSGTSVGTSSSSAQFIQRASKKVHVLRHVQGHSAKITSVSRRPRLYAQLPPSKRPCTGGDSEGREGDATLRCKENVEVECKDTSIRPEGGCIEVRGKNGGSQGLDYLGEKATMEAGGKDTIATNSERDTKTTPVPVVNVRSISRELSPFVNKKPPSPLSPHTSAGLSRSQLSRTMSLVENTFAFTRGQIAKQGWKSTDLRHHAAERVSNHALRESEHPGADCYIRVVTSSRDISSQKKLFVREKNAGLVETITQKHKDPTETATTNNLRAALGFGDRFSRPDRKKNVQMLVKKAVGIFTESSKVHQAKKEGVSDGKMSLKDSRSSAPPFNRRVLFSKSDGLEEGDSKAQCRTRRNNSKKIRKEGNVHAKTVHNRGRKGLRGNESRVDPRRTISEKGRDKNIYRVVLSQLAKERLKEGLKEIATHPPDLLRQSYVNLEPLRQGSTAAGCHLMTGWEQQRAGNLRKALHHYKKAVQFDPENLLGLSCRAVVSAHLGDYFDAIKVSTPSADSNYTHVVEIEFMGVRSRVVGVRVRYSAGGIIFHRFPSSHTSSSLTWGSRDYLGPLLFNRSIASTALGDDEGALEDLDLAVSRDGRNIMYRYNRALILRRLGDYRRAQHDYSRVQFLKVQFCSLSGRLNDYNPSHWKVQLLHSDSTYCSTILPVVLKISSVLFLTSTRVKKQQMGQQKQGKQLHNGSGKSSLPSSKGTILSPSAHPRCSGSQPDISAPSSFPRSAWPCSNQVKQYMGGCEGSAAASPPSRKALSGRADAIKGTLFDIGSINNREIGHVGGDGNVGEAVAGVPICSEIQTGTEEQLVGRKQANGWTRLGKGRGTLVPKSTTLLIQISTPRGDEIVSRETMHMTLSIKKGAEDERGEAGLGSSSELKVGEALRDAAGSSSLECGRTKPLLKGERDEKDTNGCFLLNKDGSSRSMKRSAPTPANTLDDFKATVGMPHKGDIFQELFCRPSLHIEALTTHPGKRTSVQVNAILEILSDMEDLKDLPTDTLLDIAQVVEYRVMDKHMKAFRQGGDTDAMAVILSGRISVNLRRSDGSATTTDELVEGESFGQAYMLEGLRLQTMGKSDQTSPGQEDVDGEMTDSENPDVQTIITKGIESGPGGENDDKCIGVKAVGGKSFVTYQALEPTQLLLILRKDFVRLPTLVARCKASNPKRNTQRIFDTIQRSGLFSKWEMEDMMRLVRMSRIQTHPFEEVIVKQREEPTHLHILFSGICTVTKCPDRISAINRKLLELKASLHRIKTKYAYNRVLRGEVCLGAEPFTHTTTTQTPLQAADVIAFKNDRVGTGAGHRTRIKNHVPTKMELERTQALADQLNSQHVTMAEVRKEELEKEVRLWERTLANAKKKCSEQPNTSQTQTVATLHPPKIFGESCVLVPEGGESLGTVIANTLVKTVSISKYVLQTFQITDSFLEGVRNKACHYPEDITLAKSIETDLWWSGKRRELVLE